MRKTVLITVLIFGIALAISIGPTVYADDHRTNKTESNFSSGEQLSGVIATQEASISGELEKRTFGIMIANADSPEERAKLIAEKQAEMKDREQNLSERKEAMRNKSGGAYLAEKARISQGSQTIVELSNKSEKFTKGIPQETLERKGVNVSAIVDLRENARNLSGDRVSDIARNITIGKEKPSVNMTGTIDMSERTEINMTEESEINISTEINMTKERGES